MPVGTHTREHLSLTQEGRRASPFYLGSTGMLRGTGVSPMGTYLCQGSQDGRVLWGTEHAQDVPRQPSKVPMQKGRRRCSAHREPAEIRFQINRGLIKRF